MSADEDLRIATRMSWRQAIGVGTAQTLALVPGISRSGVTMGGGLLVGLNNETPPRSDSCSPRRSSARQLRSSSPSCSATTATASAAPRLVAALCAAGAAFLSVRFLMRFFETNRLTPFAIYCVVVGPR